MGKLKGTVYESKMEKLTRPHWFWDEKTNKVAKGRRAIPILMLVRIDPSDARYKMIDGRRRRDPATLPKHRRDPEAVARWNGKKPKEGKRRKAA